MDVLKEIFATICDMSTTASVVILLILLARQLLKESPKAFSYYLWAIAGFRLVCPVSFSSMFSIFEFSPLKYFVFSEGTMSWKSSPDYKSGETLTWYAPNLTEPEVTLETVIVDGVEQEMVYESYSESLFSVNKMELLVLIWIAVLLFFLGYQLYSYFKLKKQLGMAVKMEDNIYECDKINEPFVLGFFRPRIYIPFRLKESEKEYILLHEKYHIKRHDHQVKVLAVILLGLHWFNPLVWVAYFTMCKDMEMSCDEQVIRWLGNEVKEEYSRSLLEFATDRKKWTLGALAFGETSVKERVKNILQFKKAGKVVIAFSVIVCMFMVVIGCANGGEKNAIRNVTETMTMGDPIEFEVQLSDEIESYLVYYEFYKDGELIDYSVCQYGDGEDMNLSIRSDFHDYILRIPVTVSDGKLQNTTETVIDFMEYGYQGVAPQFFLQETSSWEGIEAEQDIVFAAYNLDAGDGVCAYPCEYFQDESTKHIYTSGNAGVILFHIVFSEKDVYELKSEYEYPSNVKDLFEAKNPYIGDHVADGKLVRLLNIPTMGDSITELQTSEEPYGIILHFGDTPDNELEFHEKMLKKSAIFLALTDNAGYFEWTFPSEGDLSVEQRRYFVEDIERMLGISDLKAFAESEETLQELMIEVEHSDWAAVEAEYVCGDAFSYKELISGRHPNAAMGSTYLVYSKEEVSFEDITNYVFGSTYPKEKEMYLVPQGWQDEMNIGVEE